MLVYMCSCLYLLVCSHVDTYVYMCVRMLSHIRKNVGIPMSRIEQRPKMTFFDARTRRIHSLWLYFYLPLPLSLARSLSRISASCLIFALVYVIKCSLSLLPPLPNLSTFSPLSCILKWVCICILMSFM